MHKTKVLLLAAGLASILIAGCGGSNGPSKDEYTAKADEICRQADKDLNAIATKEFGTQMPSKQEVNRFTREEVLPNLQSQLAELRTLTPPEGDEETVNAMYDTLEKAIKDVEQSSDLTNSPQSMKDASRMARDYGFKVCGSPS